MILFPFTNVYGNLIIRMALGRCGCADVCVLCVFAFVWPAHVRQVRVMRKRACARPDDRSGSSHSNSLSGCWRCAHTFGRFTFYVFIMLDEHAFVQ